jgi:hypothetical protein
MRRATPPVPTPRPSRRWLILLALLVLGGLGAAFYYILVIRVKPAPLPLANAGRVQSSVVPRGDSLQVIVSWEFTAPAERLKADSLRVEVQIDSLRTVATRVRLHSGHRREDTVYVPAPPPGTSAEGLSCVATPPLSSAVREICTPWRYVRPSAAAQSAQARGRQGGGEPALRIVVQPGGLQIDPDIGGRCAAWQRQHPGASVWIDINRRAVPACTGPNDRPTVAQFCAFAELPDGRRVKTKNSADIPYCDALFRAWERERLS